MPRIPTQLKESEISALQGAVAEWNSPAQYHAKQRAICVLSYFTAQLEGPHVTRAAVAKRNFVPKRTLVYWIHVYRKHGIDGLKTKARAGGRQKSLDDKTVAALDEKLREEQRENGWIKP